MRLLVELCRDRLEPLLPCCIPELDINLLPVLDILCLDEIETFRVMDEAYQWF